MVSLVKQHHHVHIDVFSGRFLSLVARTGDPASGHDQAPDWGPARRAVVSPKNGGNFVLVDALGTGTTRKTITVTEQQDAWIKARIKGGDFTNDSEYIRDLIRRDHARQFKVEAVCGELIKGEESGEPRAFDGDLFKERMAARHGRKAR